MWKVSFTIQDAKKKHSALSFHLHPADYATLADVQNFVWEYARRLDPLIEGKLTDLEIAREVPLPPALKLGALPESDVEQVMNVTFSTDQQRVTTKYSIPTFNKAFAARVYATVPAEWTLDWLQDEVTDFIHLQTQALSAGHTSNTCEPRGSLVNAVKQSRLKFKARNGA